MEKKRGWWSFSVVVFGSVMLLLAGYAGSYLALVRMTFETPERRARSSLSESTPELERRIFVHNEAYPDYPQEWMYDFFRPIHRIDRRIRRRAWTIAPDSILDPSPVPVPSKYDGGPDE